MAWSSKKQERVADFNRAFEVNRSESPRIPPLEIQGLRMSLIKEETDELEKAMKAGDIVETADALADLLYVVFGCADACGINIGPVFNEVHRSNMTKIPKDGKILRRADGKILKPDHYTPPNILPILIDQGYKP